MEIISFNGVNYPKFQSEGNAAQYIMPFATKVCKGIGYDIGCGKMEWCMPGAVPIDPTIISLGSKFHAMNLPTEPNKFVDYIFSSHCLEHLETSWYDALKYWHANIKNDGVIFLYLPDYSQEYWRPWNNPKHKHILTPNIMKDAFESLGMKNIFVSGVDLMNSFSIFGQKA